MLDYRKTAGAESQRRRRLPGLERATGIEPVLPTWESKLSALYFQHLQNRPAETYVHALHTVHALPDLRIVAGRFAGRFSRRLSIASETFLVIAKDLSLLRKKLAPQLCNLGD